MAFDARQDEPDLRQDASGFPSAVLAAPDAAEAEPKPRRPWKKRLLLGVALIAALGYGGLRAHDYWTLGRFLESTDNAYLQADITEISPEVTGHIAAVPIVENQSVKAGDVLFRIDEGDYRIALEQARSQIQTHAETLKRISAQIEAARAAVTEAEANRRSAAATQKNVRTTAERIRNLASSRVASQSQLDDAEAALEEASAKLANSDAAVTSANANVAVLQAQYAESEAETRGLGLSVEQAQRNLDRTVLRAPFDGVVANVAGERGDLVSPGKILAAVVPSDALYVEANFKETQLAEMASGAVAHVTFDILPGEEFEGSVTSLAPATGAVFSLLPPENATGNFTKIVQRVPVRITLPKDALENRRLRAGLSAEVSVDTRTDAGAAPLTVASGS
jgi:membrane fusion protein, multidrug efflux system